MKKIGLLIETNAAGIKPAINGVITAARGPEHELIGLVFDGKGTEYKDELQDYGIHKILNIPVLLNLLERFSQSSLTKLVSLHLKMYSYKLKD